MEIDSPNSIHGFKRFEEEGHVRHNNFRLIDLTREELYIMRASAILDDNDDDDDDDDDGDDDDDDDEFQGINFHDPCQL